MNGWLQAFRTNAVDLLCDVRACAGVYVPCAATPPFPIFIKLCLSLQPWQQKMTNGRTVETLRLRVRLNGRASFLKKKNLITVLLSRKAGLHLLLLFKTLAIQLQGD